MAAYPFRTVALVGIDGSGKTTQARLLAAALAEAGWPASYRRNAGGRHWFGRVATALGRRDAEDLLGRRLMLVVESLLRWLAILRTVLRRAITGEIAVMDRYAVCQYASLRARGASPAAERRARLAYRLFPRPDVTVLLAVDPGVAYERIEARGYDHEDLSYLRKAAAAYRSLPEYRDFVVVDANGTPAEVADGIRAALFPARPTPAPPISRDLGVVVGLMRRLSGFAPTTTPRSRGSGVSSEMRGNNRRGGVGFVTAAIGVGTVSNQAGIRVTRAWVIRAGE